MHSAMLASYEGITCDLSIRNPAPGVIVITIAGTDVGEFGTLPIDTLSNYLGSQSSVELFIDARQTRGATLDVSGEWAIWMGTNRSRLSRINMLAGSSFIKMTADFVRRFSGLEDSMQVYTDPVCFDRDLRCTVESARTGRESFS